MDGVDVIQVGVCLRWILFDDVAKPTLMQDLGNLVETAFDVMNFKDNLPDLSPVVFADAAENVELAFFGIYFQKIDRINLVFTDDVRNRRQRAIESFTSKPSFQELIRVPVQS